METTPDRDRSPGESQGEQRRGEHNEIGYRIVSEDEEHDEQGTQGPGGGEPPAREQ